MPVSLSTIAAKDGAAATVVGGLLAMDKSGAGTGPWSLAHVLVDGVAGTLLAQITAANALKVDGSAVVQPVSLTSTTISGTVAVTQSGAWSLSANQSVNAAQINGVAPLMGNGVTGTGSQRVTVASDNTPFAVKIDQTTNGTTNKVAADLRVAGTAVDLGVGTGGAATPRVAIDSSQITTTGTAGTPSAQVVSVQGVAGGTPQANLPTLTAAANGLTKSRVNAAASTNATSLKASAGNIGEIDLFNNAAYTVYFKWYDKASPPTVGADAPVWTIPIAAGGGYSKSFPRGKTLATGIAYAITKLQADSDTTVVVAGDLTGSIDWI